jgi:lipopolysaccharide export LptBFGC system permease protein LptF
MKSKLALVTALALASSGAAYAAEKAMPKSPHQAQVTKEFNRMDKDKDSYLTVNEIRGDKELSAQMKGLDKNKDDKLDEAEFGAFEGAMAPHQKKALKEVPAGEKE